METRENISNMALKLVRIEADDFTLTEWRKRVRSSSAFGVWISEEIENVLMEWYRHEHRLLMFRAV